MIQRVIRSRKSYVIAAVVSLGPCRQSDGSTEEEDGIQRIDNDENHWMAGKALARSRRDQVEQEDHGEGGSEHAVVHTLGVAGIVLERANKSQQDDGEDKLQSAETQTEDISHFGCLGVIAMMVFSRWWSTRWWSRQRRGRRHEIDRD